MRRPAPLSSKYPALSVIYMLSAATIAFIVRRESEGEVSIIDI